MDGGMLHPRVERVLKKIGRDISYARRVRLLAAEDFARRIGVSRATLHRLENGDPGVSFLTLAMALHAIGRLEALANIADAANDSVTMMQMKNQAPKRIRRQRAAKPIDVEIEGLEEKTISPTVAGKFQGF